MIASMKEHLYGKFRVPALLILTASSALTFTMDINAASRQIFDGGTILGLFISIALFLFYKKNLLIKTNDSKIGRILSILFALTMVFGVCYKHENTATHLFASLPRIMVTILYGVGYAVFFRAAIRWVLPAFDRFCNIDSRKLPNWKILRALEAHPMRTSFFVLLACWAIYLILQFPGVLSIDAYDQLRQYFGFESWTANISTFAKEGTLINTHHSVLHTVLIGSFYKFFWKLGMPNLGVFLQCLIQLVLQGLAFAYTIQYMHKRGVSIYYRIAALLFYAFMPYFPMFGVTIVKDTLFSVLFVLCFLYFLELVRAPKETMRSWHKDMLAGLGLLLFMLFRKNGLYAILLAAPFMLIFMAKQKPFRFATSRVAAVLLAPMVVLLLIEGLLFPAIGIGKGGLQEMLSLPFQQTARYCIEHADEVTEDERAAIDKVLDYEIITTAYDPDTADPVKITYDNGSSNQDLLNYFKTWFKQLTKHPFTYVEATANTVLGYLYPDANNMYLYIGSFAIHKSGLARSVEGVIEITPPAILKKPVALLESVLELLRRIPAVGLLMSVGLQSWLWMLALAYLNWKKQLKFCIPMILQAGILITCFVSPLAGSARYVMPLFYCTPLMLATCAQFANKNPDGSENNA